MRTRIRDPRSDHAIRFSAMAKGRPQQQREPADAINPATNQRVTPRTDEAHYQNEPHDLSLLVWKYFEEEIRQALNETTKSILTQRK